MVLFTKFEVYLVEPHPEKTKLLYDLLSPLFFTSAKCKFSHNAVHMQVVAK